MSIASSRRLRLALSAVLLLLLALGLTRADLAMAAPRQPPPPARLPTGIEDLARYTPQTSCEPSAKRGTIRLARLLTRTYPGTRTGTSRTCGPSPSSEHQQGRAIDWMVSVRKPAERAKAQAVLSWLLASDAQHNRYAMARRLGVMYLIWNNRIWSASRPEEGWRPYSDCAENRARSADSQCHRNHIHISLSWEGARGVTSYWRGRVVRADYGPCRPSDLNWAASWKTPNRTPCPWYPTVRAPRGASATLRTLVTYSGRTLRQGSTGPVVKAVQKVVGVSPTGTFGPKTKAALKRWQSRHGLKPSGGVGAVTWRVLLRSQGG